MRILDSDHCIAILRGYLDLRLKVSTLDELAVTAITVGELVHGAYKSARPHENLARLDVLLATLTILSYDEGAAHHFGLVKSGLEQAGMILSDLDIQIASIALQHGAPLVTHNLQHFARVPGLSTEDWIE
jgi:tRNA(fMet)-specific endonuclease VapC